MSSETPPPSPPPGAPRQRDREARIDVEGLVERIKWTTFARTLALTGLLVLTVAMDLGLGPQPQVQAPEVLLYQIETSFFVLTFLALLTTYLAPAALRPSVAWLSLAIDVALAATLVAVTGRTQSVFLFGMPLAVLSAAALLERRGAIAAASLGSAAMMTLAAVDLGWLGPLWRPYTVVWLRGVGDEAGHSAAEVIVAVLVQVAALYATALLSSKLVAELARARAVALREQREFLALRQRFEDVFSSMPDGLLTVSDDGVIRSANGAAAQILGESPALLVDRPLVEVLPELGDGARAMGATQEIARSPEPTTEVFRPGADGGQQVLTVRAEQLRGRVFELRGQRETLYVIRDITELRARELAHRNRERLASIGAMAMAVAHEIRNPLASISGAVQMLGASLPDDPSTHALGDIIVRETAQLSRWIGEFLEFAKPSQLRQETVDLAGLVKDKVEAWRSDPRVARDGVAVDVAIPATRLDLRVDPSGVSSLVWNLLTNAEHAAAESSQPRVAVSLRGDDHAIALVVEDSGTGVSDEDRPHIFEPFYSSRRGGTGLGLATVRRAVEAHEGSIELDRSPRLGGARFTVWLPRVRRREGSPPT